MLNKRIIEDIFFEALANGGDFAEVFIEDNFSKEIATVGGVIERGMSGRDFGVGIRVFSGLNSVYGYSNDASKENLLNITKKITKTLKKSEKEISFNFDKNIVPNLHKYEILPSTVDFSKKIELTKRAYQAGKAYDDSISQMTVNYLDQEQNVLIANTDGVFVEDQRVKTRMLIVAASEYNGQIETGYIGPGALMGSEFYDQIDIEEYAREAARNAKTMARADYCHQETCQWL